MYVVGARDALVDAAKALIWERGVAATSPHALLETAGVGQGSLYHHFRGKDAWALAGIEALAGDLDAATAATLGDARTPGLARLRAYLDAPRAARAGCRLGRLAFDPHVAAEPALAAPIRDYFARLRTLLSAAARDAVAEGGLRGDVDPDDLATAVAAVVQGGFVLSRAGDDEDAMTAATRAVRALLDAARPPH